MTGTLYIDGVDILQRFGVFVHNGGYAGLAGYPPLKAVDSNNWLEEDGIEPDLSDPHLDTKTFNMTFGGSNAPGSEIFIHFLAGRTYRLFEFRQLGITRRLRLVGQDSRRTLSGLEVFSLQFADDFPLDGYEYLEPLPLQSVSPQGYRIDGRELSEYGMRVLDGSDDDILKSPAVKANLLVNTGAHDGAVYFGDQVVFQAKDIALRCQLRADTETFWRNYNALLHDLVQPGERTFHFGKRGEEFPCHYKSSAVDVCSLNGDDMWCEFTLTLTLTSFRVGEIEYLLAVEDGRVIVTEDEQFYLDMF